MSGSEPEAAAPAEAAVAADTSKRKKFDNVFKLEVLEKKNKKGKRLPGGGRRLKLKQFDQDVAVWWKQAREKKLPVTRTLIFQEAAKKLQAHPAGPDGKPVLILSTGWLQKFMRRHHLTLRKPTSVAQKAPIDCEDKIVSFVLFTENLRKKRKFKHIFGADETGIWLNPTGGLCVEQIGAKDVTVLASGNTKLRISVMLTACSDGTRMKPFVLLPYKEHKSKIAKAIKDKFGKRIHLVFKNTTWMNDEIVEEYLQKNFGGLFQPRRLLVWDAFKAHISHNTKAVMKRLNVEMSVIP
ncbi:pogo transposable element with KRAB domain-like protein, partial [Aphelenchoides avenae]